MNSGNDRDPSYDWRRSDLRYPNRLFTVSPGSGPCFKTGIIHCSVARLSPKTSVLATLLSLMECVELSSDDFARFLLSVVGLEW